ncbi:MAG TPA: hypothetical protein VG602_08405 [Actinomycetota bacterium]|nr:hypothetical protein [Actinomycetota bacterium]
MAIVLAVTGGVAVAMARCAVVVVIPMVGATVLGAPVTGVRVVFVHQELL